MRKTILVLAPCLASLAFLPGCGGDSGGTFTGRASTSDKAFCQEIEQLDSLDIQTDIAKAADILAELARKAPNSEVRNALNVIAPIFAKISTVDQNDPNAMQEILASMSSPDVQAASQVLDRYGKDICGFTSSGDSVPGDSVAVSTP